MTGCASYLTMGTMILIHPPVAKACEPPAGITKLAGFLGANGVDCLLLDLNLEGTLHLLETRVAQSDTWTKRAVRNVSRNLNALRDWQLFENHDRYNRAVMDLNRILTAHGQETGSRLSLSDYQHESSRLCEARISYGLLSIPTQTLSTPTSRADCVPSQGKLQMGSSAFPLTTSVRPFQLFRCWGFCGESFRQRDWFLAGALLLRGCNGLGGKIDFRAS